MLLLSLAAVLAGSEPALPAAQGEPVQAAAAKPKMVCKSVAITGTRLARNRICMTKKQWSDEADEINRTVTSGLGRTGKAVSN